MMNESSIKVDALLSDVSAHFVNQYGMSPRDAVGIVMQSPLTEDIRTGVLPIDGITASQLAARIFH